MDLREQFDASPKVKPSRLNILPPNPEQDENEDRVVGREGFPLGCIESSQRVSIYGRQEM